METVKVDDREEAEALNLEKTKKTGEHKERLAELRRRRAAGNLARVYGEGRAGPRRATGSCGGAVEAPAVIKSSAAVGFLWQAVRNINIGQGY